MALKDFTAGEVLTADDVDVYLKNTIFARKTADESVTSSTALQDDDHLTLQVAANSVYEFHLSLHYTGAPGDLKFQFVLPAGATIFGSSMGLTITAASSTDDYVQFADEGAVYAVGNTGTLNAYVIQGILVVGGTAGTAKIQWAQNTSSGTATVLKAGSYWTLHRVD